ncbi:MAG: hypothetical protein GKC00_02785, partial [Candidatus Methanofastidiosa archaeon]|nr:hypothetical protein [Candidatus Methanofastidiosa archaeon]
YGSTYENASYVYDLDFYNYLKKTGFNPSKISLKDISIDFYKNIINLLDKINKNEKIDIKELEEIKDKNKINYEEYLNKYNKIDINDDNYINNNINEKELKKIFSENEIKIAFDEEGFLNNKDPKLFIALNTFDSSIDPNDASYDELLRVPGIGPKSAYRIVNYRKKSKIYKREQLLNLGVRVKNATPFLKINGGEYPRLDRWIECQTQ